LVLGLGVACGGDDAEDTNVGAEAGDTAGTETTAGDGDGGTGDGGTGDGDTGDGDTGDGDTGDGDTGDGDTGDGDTGDGDTGDGDTGDGDTGDAICEAAADDDECVTCAKASCCDEVLACEADEKCLCLSDCVVTPADIVQCNADCAVVGANQPFNLLGGCLTVSCTNECA